MIKLQDDIRMLERERIPFLTMILVFWPELDIVEATQPSKVQTTQGDSH